ncbi:hypothetical protein HT737_09710 [Pseudomonas sp. MD195_PC81_125]|uniref:hypothetical protein n=1 Tax=Pseudomonas sp. MD195_PC81_125 TaxID=2741560 RepID=UPI0015FBF9E1|nr:hypothetical protein [Pseudomonas sp. MD195_PC81_125]MBA5980254.1 hypothetical protein [Pseudomonas sp. MD195_PC81_125]
MASDKKQAKRAKRTKAKAKQARTVRNGSFQRSYLETVEVSEGMVSLLVRMAEAEAISQVEMLTTLISDSGMSKAETLDDEVDMQIVLLKVYGRKIEGRTEDWMEDDGFLEAYAQAARRLGREELIGAWHDAHDF